MGTIEEAAAAFAANFSQPSMEELRSIQREWLTFSGCFVARESEESSKVRTQMTRVLMRSNHDISLSEKHLMSSNALKTSLAAFFGGQNELLECVCPTTKMSLNPLDLSYPN